jgi:outer membrane protein assembly factor BamB
MLVSSTSNRRWFFRPLRVLAGCAVLTAGMAWAIHRQFGVEEIHRADDAVNVPLAIPAATVHDWPGEFGSDGSGSCPRDGLPHENYEFSRIAWRTAVPGLELGGPCVWGKLAILPVLDPTSRTLSLEAYHVDDGNPAWKTTLAADLDLQANAAMRAATPACDGQAVYLAAAIDGRLRVYAIGLDGKSVWDRDAGPMMCENGRLVSPLLFESLVIVSAEHSGAPLHAWRASSHLTALHRLNGEIIYRVRRPNGDGWTTPALAKTGERTQLIVQSRNRITAYDPGRGEPIWWFHRDAVRIAHPVAWDSERIYAGSGDPHSQFMAIRTDGEGDVTDTHLAWRTAAAGPMTVSPVSHRGLVLCLQADGGLTAVDASSGKVLWRKSLTGTFVRPPIPVGDDILCLSAQGKAYVVNLTQRGEEMFEWHLPAGIVAPAAATAERLIARDHDGIFSFPIGERRTSPIVNAPSRPANRF